MEGQGFPMDVISSLPPNIIQTILTLLPMRDAFRTSILSCNWRHYCVNIPKLKFDDELFEGSNFDNLSIKCKLLHVIYPVLLLHDGPILDFSLCISQLHSCCEIDQIILHLSRNSPVKSFNLCIGAGNDHKLLLSFFILQQLTHLKLTNCVFQPPSTFNGFSKLTSLYFYNVSITAKVLLRFISNCPLLKSFTLIEDERHLLEYRNSGFIELFKCLPLIEHLHLSSYPVKFFATGVMPQKLPIVLVHLRVLNLSGLCFAREVDLRSALLLVTSSPSLEKIYMAMYYDPKEAVAQTALNLLDLQDYSYLILDHLHELEIKSFANLKPVLDFVKLILAKSPLLRKVRIVIDDWVSGNDEIIMLRILLRYQRASTKAEIIIERPP